MIIQLNCQDNVPGSITWENSSNQPQSIEEITGYEVKQPAVWANRYVVEYKLKESNRTNVRDAWLLFPTGEYKVVDVEDTSIKAIVLRGFPRIGSPAKYPCYPPNSLEYKIEKQNPGWTRFAYWNGALATLEDVSVTPYYANNIQLHPANISSNYDTPNGSNCGINPEPLPLDHWWVTGMLGGEVVASVFLDYEPDIQIKCPNADECPEGTCKVDCGSVYCCYGSDGIAVSSFEK